MINKLEINRKIQNVIAEVRSTKSIGSFPSVSESLDDTEQDLLHNEFKITIVGEFSSGKSTFLNSIIGKDILPHGVKETTATVTYIHNVSESDALVNKAVIHFRNDGIKDVTIDVGKDRNALINYVTTSKEKYDVVHDIMAVDIYVHFTSIDDPIVLIDTPGMNGVAEGHGEITLSEIRHSHASICLFHLRGMGKSDLQFIREVMKYQNTFFFVLNAIDDLKDNEETYEGRMEAFANDIKNIVYEGKKKPEYVFGISALKALVARDTTIARLYDSDKADLTPADRVRILEESHMPEFEKVLFNYLRNSDKEKEFYQVICQRLIATLESYKSAADIDKGIREAKVGDIPEKKKIQEQINKVEKIVSEFRTNIETSTKALFEDLRSNIYTSIREDLTAENDRQLAEVNKLTFDNALKVQDDGVITKNINRFYGSEVAAISDQIKRGVNDVMETQTAEMKRSLPSVSFKDKKVNIDVSSFEAYEEDNSTMSRLQKKRKERESVQKKISGLANTGSSSELQKQLAVLEREESQLQNAYRSELRSLGSRPGVEYTTRAREVKTKGGFWRSVGSFFGFCDEYKTETVYETVKDYSAQREYDREKASIKNKYDADVAQKQKQKENMERLVAKAQQNEDLRNLYASKIAQLEADIKREEAMIEEARRNSKNSFLKRIQGELRKQLNGQLAVPDGQIYVDLTEGVRTNLSKFIKPVKESLFELLDQSKADYLTKLNKLIVQVEGRNNVEENTRAVQLLTSDIKTIDNCITNIKNISNGL